MVKVHYFFDPMCGWCYAASPLIDILAQTPNFEIIYHPGGMIPKRSIEASFRQHIMQADRQITQMTNVQFGDAYRARVAGNDDYVVDSYSTTRAFLVGQNMGVDAHKMLTTIQQAHYLKGEHLHEFAALQKMAASIGLPESEWNEKMAASEPEMHKAIQNSHTLMSQWQVSGFPTLIIEKDGKLIRLPHSSYYGKPTEWAAYLTTLAG